MLSRTQKQQSGSIVVIIVTIVVIVIVVGALTYFALSALSKKDGSASQILPFFKATTATTSDEVKSLISTAKTGVYDAKCTYDDGANSKGTIYISGSTKIRVDTTINDKPGHVLRVGDAGYIWADGESKGSKLPFRSKESAGDRYSPDTFANNADKYQMRCESVRNLNDSLFTLPKDVEFVDVNTQFQSYSSEQ